MKTLKNEIVQLDPYGRVNLVQARLDRDAPGPAGAAAPRQVERVARTMALRQLAPKDIARAVAWLAFAHRRGPTSAARS